jgi:hypothetical protein
VEKRKISYDEPCLQQRRIDQKQRRQAELHD